MIGNLIYLVIYIIIIGVVIWLLNVLIERVPMDPEFRRIAQTVLLIIGALIVVLLLLDFVGLFNFGMVGRPRPLPQ